MYRILIMLLAVALAGCFGNTPNKNAVPPAATLIGPTTPANFATRTPEAQNAPEQLPGSLPPVGRTPLTTPDVLARFPLLNLPGAGRSPTALALAGGSLYSANRATNNVALISNDRVSTFIPVGDAPVALAAEPSGRRIYVSNYYTPSISVIEVDRVVKMAAVPSAIQALVLYGNRLFVGLGESGVVEARDSETLQKTASVQLNKSHGVLRFVVDPSRNRLYAVSFGLITVLDLVSLKELYSFEADSTMGAAALDPVDDVLWVGIYDQVQRRGAMVLYDGEGKETKRLMLDDDLSDATFDSKGRLYVVSSFTNRMTVVDGASGRILARVNVAKQPNAIVLDEPNRKIYVANRDSDSVSVIDLGSYAIVGSIPLAPRLTAVTVNEELSRVYVANASSDSVFVLVNTNVVGEIRVGHHPSDLARDSKTGRLFVANEADATLSVVDESSLTVQATLPVTGTLSSVATDAGKRRLFANGTLMGLDTLQPESLFLAKGVTVGSAPAPVFVRTDPARGKLFAVASNGIPGSNSRTVPYLFSENDPSSARPLAYSNGGNVTALIVDSASSRVYAGVTHPLAYRTALVAWDSNGDPQFELAMGSRISGLAANPATNHLFIAHANTYPPFAGLLTAHDNAIQVIDARTQGDVNWLEVPGAPGPMAMLENTVYVGGTDDGWMTLIGDATTPAPPAPTSTSTPTLYPTLPPISLAPTIKPVAGPTVANTLTPLARTTAIVPSPASPTQIASTETAIPLLCSITPADPFSSKWSQVRDAIGCPTAAPAPASFAYQALSGGSMYDDLRNPAAQTIYVLYPDGTYSVFVDTWKDGQPTDSCPSISPAPGLIKPIRGFGKVWCEQTPVRMRMPGANIEEYAVVPYVQSYERGLMLAYTPQGVIALFTNMMWK